MTSIPVQPAWPTRSISTGRGPALPPESSRTISWPDPVRAVMRRPVPSERAIDVLMVTEATPWTGATVELREESRLGLGPAEEHVARLQAARRPGRDPTPGVR